MSRAPWRGPEAPPPPPPRSEEGAPVPSPVACLALTASAWVVAMLVTQVLAPETGPVAALAVGLTLGLGALGTMAARAVPTPVESRLGLVPPDLRALHAIPLLLPLPLVLSELDNGLAELLTRPAPPGAGEEGGGSGATALELGLLLVGLRPVLEEFFFRGVLLQGLVSALGRARGVLLDALLFAALRAAFYGSAFVAASTAGQAFLAGLVLAGLRLATGSLVPGILLQITLAALGLVAVEWEGAPQIPGFNAPGAHSPPELVVPALLAVVAGAALVLRAVRRAPPLPPIPREPAEGSG